MRFLDIKTDYAFKKVFGSNQSKDILISFLNAILEYDIEDLTIEDPYNVPKLAGMKDTAVDVKATLRNKKKVIIEMHDGKVKNINTNPAPLDPYDFALRASAQTWKEFGQLVPKPMFHGIWSASFQRDLKIEEL